MDLEARANKRGGAWMNHSETGHTLDGEVILPVAYIVCNFTPSTKNLKSLLSHGEVLTLFHEMGHVLQHICSEDLDYTSSGIGGVEWDAVEWSSQFLELFTYEDTVLKQLGQHIMTDEVIPTDLIQKINDMKNYRQGNAMIRQIEFGMFDMRIHSSNITTKEFVQTTLDTIREELKTNHIEVDKFQCGFSHIFSGGYSAGYYSYKWAEVLSVDAYLTFKERNDGEKYYNDFLSKGSSKTSKQMFISYVGREPKEDNLIKYFNLDD
jgi:oligopeptidase A